MAISDESNGLDTRLKTMQIVWAALLSGVAMFLVIALVVRSGRGEILVPDRARDFSLMLVVSAAFIGVAGVLASFTIPSLLVNGQVQSLATRASGKGHEIPPPPTLPLLTIYQSRLILGLALLEGAAFFNLVVFLVEGSPISLAVSVVLLIFMASHVPTRARIMNWIDDQKRRFRDAEDRTGVS